MPKIEIDLTVDEKKAWDDMLGKQTLEDYMKSIAATHEVNDLDKKWSKKTKAEKKALIG